MSNTALNDRKYRRKMAIFGGSGSSTEISPQLYIRLLNKIAKLNLMAVTFL